jgi:hypothetical protein
VQIVAPFGLLAPQPVSSVAGGLAIFHQVWLVLSGNYAWLNWLTMVLGVAALSLPAPIPVHLHARPAGYDTFALLLAGITIALSVKPVLNLASKDQAMNLTYNPLHLVGTYGAFGSVTRQRYEVVLEGTESEDPRGEQAQWLEYEHRGKPGPVTRMPPQVAPYHLRLLVSPIHGRGLRRPRDALRLRGVVPSARRATPRSRPADPASLPSRSPRRTRSALRPRSLLPLPVHRVE